MSRVMGILLALLASAIAAQAADVSAPVILVFGDSISAGYGIRPERGWVNLLAQKIDAADYGFRVANASVSGETTAGGLARLPRALILHKPRIVVLELGGNDGLRGLPLATSRRNLEQMVAFAKAKDAQVLLLGMRMPPNYGQRYTAEFQAMYQEIAARQQIPLLPFLLDRVAQNPALMQQDRIHPTEQGQAMLLDNVWPKLLPLLRPGRARGHSKAG